MTTYKNTEVYQANFTINILLNLDRHSQTQPAVYSFAMNIYTKNFLQMYPGSHTIYKRIKLTQI
jgi:hypothetical protein